MCPIIDAEKSEEDGMGLLRWLISSALRNKAYALESEIELKNKKVQKMLDGSEKSMMPILLANQGSIVRSDKSVLAREEFSAGTGIADVVMFTVDDALLSERLNKQQAALTDYRLLSTYIAVTKNPGMSKEELVSMLRFPRKALLEDTLPALIECGLIEENNSRVYCLADEIQSPVMKCVAIEAKVKDWKSGIKQACRYKEFADETYLAIYKKHSKVPLENIDLFRALDVGLLIVDDGHVEVAHLAGNNSFKFINRLLASERLISTLDDFNKPFMPREPFATSRL